MVAQTVGVGRRLWRELEPALTAAARVRGADRYRKHFSVRAHVGMLLGHVLSGSGSLRQSHGLQMGDVVWRRRLGLASGISYSQLARSSQTRPLACFTAAWEVLARQVQARGPAHVRRVVAVDGSFLALSAACSPWSVHQGHEAGVRLQMAYAVDTQVPTRLQVTLADANDVTAFKRWDLARWQGWTLLLDLGYYAHRVFAQMREAGVHFVTRLHPQAAYCVVRERAVTGARTPAGDVVVRDAVIVLGSANNRNGAVLAEMRLVVSRTAQGKTHHFITDRHDLSAPEVVWLYRKRWQIELFFRWLKHVLGAIRPIGYSRAAVWLTLVVASIVAVLAQLLEELRPASSTRVSWLRTLAASLPRALRFSG